VKTIGIAVWVVLIPYPTGLNIEYSLYRDYTCVCLQAYQYIIYSGSWYRYTTWVFWSSERQVVNTFYVWLYNPCFLSCSWMNPLVLELPVTCGLNMKRFYLLLYYIAC